MVVLYVRTKNKLRVEGRGKHYFYKVHNLNIRNYFLFKTKFRNSVNNG